MDKEGGIWIMNVQWYPGHMAKTRRLIAEQLGKVHAVCEILDARIPQSSRNPDIDALTAGKPRLVILNRADQADRDAAARWIAHFRARGFAVLETDAKSGRGCSLFAAAVRDLLSDKIRAWEEKGQAGRIVRVMVLGIPNVGKSTFINRVAGRKAAAAEDRPGVTRGKQWVGVDKRLELLDTPGVLWPKFEDQTVGLHLAFTGAVKDDVLDMETLGCHLAALLGERYPESLKGAYKLPDLPERIDAEQRSFSGTEQKRDAEQTRKPFEQTEAAREAEIAWGLRILEAAGRKRGFLIRGGEVDTERCARILLDEFRSGKLGRFTLEEPE